MIAGGAKRFEVMYRKRIHIAGLAMIGCVCAVPLALVSRS